MAGSRRHAIQQNRRCRELQRAGGGFDGNLNGSRARDALCCRCVRDQIVEGQAVLPLDQRGLHRQPIAETRGRTYFTCASTIGQA